jgi:excisionase family DNA binding protein
METRAFLTSMSEAEFKSFLKESLQEILRENKSNSHSTVSDIFNIRQAAAYLKLKVSTLYEKTSGRLIPHFKRGNRIYFNLSDLQDYIKCGRVKTKEELQTDAITYRMRQHPHKGMGSDNADKY